MNKNKENRKEELQQKSDDAEMFEFTWAKLCLF